MTTIQNEDVNIKEDQLSDQKILAWAKRHDVMRGLDELRTMVDDAATLHMCEDKQDGKRH